MREFRDDQGRPWMLALTVAAAERVRGMVTIDVTEDVEQPDGSVTRQTRAVPFDLIDVENINRTLTLLRTSYGKIGEILYAICRQQVADKNLTKEEFLEGLRGDAMDAATKALEQELVDFFPQGLRRMVRLLGAKMDELAAEMRSRSEAAMEAATIENLGLSGTQSMRPPESLESIPANGPCGSSSSPEIADSKWIGGTPPTSSPNRQTSTRRNTRRAPAPQS